jgi:hypothetical protein
MDFTSIAEMQFYAADMAGSIPQMIGPGISDPS